MLSCVCVYLAAACSITIQQVKLLVRRAKFAGPHYMCATCDYYTPAAIRCHQQQQQ
jgi:hypothetical protein